MAWRQRYAPGGGLELAKVHHCNLVVLILMDIVQHSNSNHEVNIFFSVVSLLVTPTGLRGSLMTATVWKTASPSTGVLKPQHSRNSAHILNPLKRSNGNCYFLLNSLKCMCSSQNRKNELSNFLFQSRAWKKSNTFLSIEYCQLPIQIETHFFPH